MSHLTALTVHEYGTTGAIVIVIHGGPGAAGEVGPVARELADAFHVFEPWQRPSGTGVGPLTVARHVADLDHLLQALCPSARPALVGHSWGAMLALIYAAAHPDRAGPIVLIGCATFDTAARERMRTILDRRMDDDLKRQLQGLPEQIPDPAQRMARWLKLTEPLYTCDPLPLSEADEADRTFDERAHIETWDDMIALQEQGIYPAALNAIHQPILMMHGEYDPHPGKMIRDSLLPHVPQLEYRQWSRCGHSPWRERLVCDAFFDELRQWLGEHAEGTEGQRD